MLKNIKNLIGNSWESGRGLRPVVIGTERRGLQWWWELPDQQRVSLKETGVRFQPGPSTLLDEGPLPREGQGMKASKALKGTSALCRTQGRCHKGGGSWHFILWALQGAKGILRRGTACAKVWRSEKLQGLGIRSGPVWLKHRLSLEEQGKEKGQASKRLGAWRSFKLGGSRQPERSPSHSRANSGKSPIKAPGTERNTCVKSHGRSGPRGSIAKHSGLSPYTSYLVLLYTPTRRNPVFSDVS